MTIFVKFLPILPFFAALIFSNTSQAKVFEFENGKKIRYYQHNNPKLFSYFLIYNDKDNLLDYNYDSKEIIDHDMFIIFVDNFYELEKFPYFGQELKKIKGGDGKVAVTASLDVSVEGKSRKVLFIIYNFHGYKANYKCVSNNALDIIRNYNRIDKIRHIDYCIKKTK